MPIIPKTACDTKKIIYLVNLTSANFCNNKVPSTLQYNAWSVWRSSFRSHLTDENSKRSPLYLRNRNPKHTLDFIFTFKLLSPKKDN